LGPMRKEAILIGEKGDQGFRFERRPESLLRLFLPISPIRNGFDSFSSTHDGASNVVGVRKKPFPEKALLPFPNAFFGNPPQISPFHSLL
jgi:hypothetical protein